MGNAIFEKGVTLGTEAVLSIKVLQVGLGGQEDGLPGPVLFSIFQGLADQRMAELLVTCLRRDDHSANHHIATLGLGI